MVAVYKMSDFAGIDINEVMKADIYYLSKVKSKEGLKERLALYYSNFTRSSFDFSSIASIDKCHVLGFRSLVRDDYKNLFNQIMNQIDSKSLIKLEDYQKNDDKLNLNAVRFMTKNLSLLTLIEESDPIRKACIFVLFCNYLYVLDAIRKINFKVLVVFADMQPVDNLLVNFFKQRGVKTVTLQHGLYVEYENYETVNSVNYEQQCADYFLAWGECTGSLIKKYHPNTKVVICGKPQISILETKLNKALDGMKFMLVILDQSIFDEQNYEMISIARNYALSKSINVVVKFHPQNDKDKYFIKFPFIIEGDNLKDAELVIGHTSTLLFESLALGYKVMKYCTDIPSLPLDSKFQFNSFEELDSKFCFTFDSVKYSRFYLSFTGEESNKRYYNFFKGLCT